MNRINTVDMFKVTDFNFLDQCIMDQYCTVQRSDAFCTAEKSLDKSVTRHLNVVDNPRELLKRIFKVFSS